MQKSEQFPDIDSRINWLDFYSPYLKNPKPCGKDKMHACCPFHEERHPSFWFNTKNGCFKCEGCGEKGNATDFLAKIKGIDTKEAYKELLELAGIDPNKQSAKPQKKELPAYEPEGYANEKYLPLVSVTEDFEITGGKDSCGQYIKIPYKDKDGKIVATRKRYHKDNPNGKFKWQKGSTLRLYGLWRKLSEDFVILIEGESDSQSLWVLGFPAYGVPGATNFQTKWVDDLKDIPKIYLHIEPDKGGQTFRQQMISKLYEGGYQGEVYTFNLGECNVKDPSELYCRDGVDATDEIWAAIALAERVDLQSEAESLPELVSGMPVLLKEPEGWKLSDDGIFKYEARTEQYKRVCRTPIIIVKRLRNIETDEEKIQVAFKIRGHWKFGIFPSTTIYQSRNIVSLADLGALITSENSKQVVSFLEALESENIERIKEAKSVSQLGWATDENFLPGFDGGIILDAPKTIMKKAENMLSPQGTLQEWINIMQPHRDNNYIFRFYLSAAFAPLLMDILKVKNVIVYLWCSSGGGKTALLKACCSAFGNPDLMMITFFSTQVGIERTIEPLQNMPFFIDERQLAGEGQAKINEVVYMIGTMRGKQRGKKDGGVDDGASIKGYALCTGEESLTRDTTMGGVINRSIEIYGKPFENEADASSMHRKTAICYGTAWKVFVNNIILSNKQDIYRIYEKFNECLCKISQGQGFNHSDMVATICTADYLLSIWVFGTDKKIAFDSALYAGAKILLMQPTESERDVNKKALQFINEWIVSNKKRFEDSYMTPRYGFISAGKYYIVPSILKEALKNAGYSVKKTVKFLIENNVLPDKDAGTVSKYFENTTARMYEYDYQNAQRLIDGTNSIEDFEGFTEIDDDSDLPF